MKAVTNHVVPAIAVLSCALVFSALSHANFLDRLRKKANEATEEIRDVRDDVQDITSADDRAVSEVQAQQNEVQREIESATDVEGQARGAVHNSEPVQAANELEREIVHLETTDERAEAQVQYEVAVVERDIEVATDVERQAEQAVLNSQAGRAAVQTERRIEHIEQTDERVEANAVRAVDETLGVSDAQRDVRNTQRDVRDTERALDNLGNALD